MRNGLLLDALGRPVDLNAVDWHVRQRNPSASPSEVQNETLDVIRALVGEGLFSLGSVGEKDKRFVASEPAARPFDPQDLPRLCQTLHDDPERWMFSAWMLLTEEGEQLARSLEEKDIGGYRGRG